MQKEINLEDQIREELFNEYLKEKFGKYPVTLKEQAFRITLNKHRIATIDLLKAFCEKDENNKFAYKIYFSHKNEISNGILKKINYFNKELEYIELQDKCITPSTYYDLPKTLLESITIKAKKINKDPDDDLYLVKDEHGFYIDFLTIDYIENWTQLYENVRRQNLLLYGRYSRPVPFVKERARYDLIRFYNL